MLHLCEKERKFRYEFVFPSVMATPKRGLWRLILHHGDTHHLFKRQSRYRCEAIFFLDEITIYICRLWENRLPSTIWVGLIQSVEGTENKDWGSLEKREFCFWTAFWVKLWHHLFPGSLPCWSTLYNLDLTAPTSTWAKSLLSLSPLHVGSCFSEETRLRQRLPRVNY